jgi:DNA-binding response OmpR family regulator
MSFPLAPRPGGRYAVAEWEFVWSEAAEEPLPDEPREGIFVRPPTSYRRLLGDEPIPLGQVEFRIMLLLASRPYHAFTRRQIAEAIATDEQPVAAEEVDAYVSALRDQLGVLHDFVQTVPYVGYRFKA